MTKIILNSEEFTISGYNRYTSIDDGVVHSTANVNFPDNSGFDDLTALAEETITSIQITIDGAAVYTLSNQSAKITNITENLYEHGVSMNCMISFPAESPE